MGSRGSSARRAPARSLRADQARRLILAAQGLASPPPPRVTARTVRSLLSRLAAIQIDSINVVARSHELVLASRLGVDASALFDRVIYRQRAGFEHWGHAASFMPIDLYRHLIPRMRRRAEQRQVRREVEPEVYDAVLGRIGEEGPLPASAFNAPDGPRRGEWWDWTPAKQALENLFTQGELLVHDRVRFERRYDLAERVLPAGLDVSEPTRAEATVALVLRAAAALGVATVGDLADHFRLVVAEARAAIEELAGAGLLEPVAVEGWPRPAFMIPGTPIPRATDFPPTLISPFDSLVWAAQPGARERTQRIFAMDYTLEIYLRPEQRRHGYYTMPVLAGGRLVARVDPKLDRASGVLLLRSVHLEEGVDRDEALSAVRVATERLAAILGAGACEVAAPAQA